MKARVFGLRQIWIILILTSILGGCQFQPIKPPPRTPTGDPWQDLDSLKLYETGDNPSMTFQPIREYSVMPAFPKKAIDNYQEGWVMLEYRIGEDGKTKDVEVLDASPLGYGFEEEARNAVEQWVYPKVAYDKMQGEKRKRLVQFRIQTSLN